MAVNETHTRGEERGVLTPDGFFHLQFTGTCIFHSWKQLIGRFIWSGASTALNGSIPAECFRERDLAEYWQVQEPAPDLCPK